MTAAVPFYRTDHFFKMAGGGIDKIDKTWTVRRHSEEW